MASRLRFLLDTNIFIPLQDSTVPLQSYLRNFIRLCNINGHQILCHPASIEDIQRDSNLDRRNRTIERLSQYPVLQVGPTCPWNTPQTSPNDACDNKILYALQNNAVHALVTEDQKLHRNAQRRGLGDRVYFIQSANDWLQRLHEPPIPLLPNIYEEELHLFTDQLTTPFFDTLRVDYADFDVWFKSKAQEGRRAWIYRDSNNPTISALCIFTIQTNARVTDNNQILAGDSLKLCTFKVGESVRGRKIGELFLRAAFQYATKHRCTSIFLHANADQQKHLKHLLEDFGFCCSGLYKNDKVYIKAHPIESPALEIKPFQYLRLYYPHYLSGLEVSKFLVPIQPQYHKILFPDYLNPGHSLPLSHPLRHVGNAIKLAYLCNTLNKQPQPGDVVLFYQSYEMKAVTTLGIVEHYSWSTSADEIARIVSRRTVYSYQQIEQMSQKSETKIMLFRLIKHFDNPITYQELQRQRIVSGPIQSITKISDESFSRIIRAAER